MPRRKAIGQALLVSQIACFFALVVITLGAWTRLVDAGLGCPDWPGCYGHLIVPTSSAQLAQANVLFPNHIVEADKGWPEMIHRYAAGTLGLLISWLALKAWQWRKLNSYPRKLSFLLLALVITQALFGMWTVTLKLWPPVVTLHLLGGMGTLALLFILSLRLRRFYNRWADREGWSEMRFDSLLLHDHGQHEWALLWKLRQWASFALLILVLQIGLGGWTSANYAAMACPDFPSCQGQWFPGSDIQQAFNLLPPVGENYLGGQLDAPARIAIHMTHRIGAVVTLLVLGGLAFYMLKNPFTLLLQVRAFWLMSTLVLQLSLGIANVLLSFPLFLAVLHNLGAALLLLALCNLLWYLQALHPPLPVGGMVRHA